MSFRIALFSIIYLLVNSIFCAYCVHVPRSPCPEIFQYVEDTNGTYYGIITLPYTDGAKYNISTGVSAWMPGYHPEISIKHVEITMITPYEDLINNTTRTLVYNVNFPFPSVIPLISAIALNDKIYCSGPPIPANDGNTEFTTCGQTHYLDFPPICEDNQESSESNSEVPLDSQDLQKRNQVQLDASEITKDNDLNDQTKYVDLPPYIEDNKHNGLQDVQSYSENRQSSTKTPDIDLSPFSVDLGINNQPDDETNEQVKHDFTQNNKITRATDTASGYNHICGRPSTTNSLVFYGKGVPRGAYPWLVAIFRTLDSFGIHYICSGSLVSNKHVITAAHCLMKNSRRLKPHEVVCMFGKLNIETWGVGEDEKMIQPDDLILHPEYSGKPNADIAVMVFANTIIFNQLIKPLCLWQGSNELKEIVGNMGTVVSWGTQEKDPDNAEPKQIDLPVVDQFECLKGSSPLVQHTLLDIVSENTFCAGFRNGSGPCMGDSGSAFLIKRDKVFYLRGIVSTAVSDDTVKSCNLNEYVVITDASKYLDWIKEKLK